MDINKYLEMLRYKRPEGSITQKAFCNEFLKPVFGNPDRHGNFTMIIGDKPNISFMSHHDTVHSTGGFQNVLVNGNEISSDSNCLGADCTTGVWIMLEMIKANVEGVYVVHAGEEIGLVGSSAIVADHPEWIDHVDIAISFDRKGTKSIITKQMSQTTASDSFAYSLADALGMHELTPDPTGSYTDSEAYTSVIAECTNISVGYVAQHTSKETQDINFMVKLTENFIAADLSKLVVSRNPETSSNDEYEKDIDDLTWLAQNYPDKIAELLLSAYDVSEVYDFVSKRDEDKMIDGWF